MGFMAADQAKRASLEYRSQQAQSVNAGQWISITSIWT